MIEYLQIDAGVAVDILQVQRLAFHLKGELANVEYLASQLNDVFLET